MKCEVKWTPTLVWELTPLEANILLTVFCNERGQSFVGRDKAESFQVFANCHKELNKAYHVDLHPKPAECQEPS